MAAAQQLFLDKGVDATTISDIVAAAGVAKGTFYHYFQAKTDILLALRERFTQAFQQRIANAVEACPANDHPGRLRAWTESGLAGYLEGYRLHDVVYSEHHHHQRGNQERDRVLEQLAELLENGAAAGAWPLRNPRLNALLLYSGLHGASPAAAWIPSRWPANSPMPSCACSVPATEAGSAAEGFLQVAPVQPPFVVTVQDYGGQALAATRRVGLDFPIGQGRAIHA